MMPQEEDGFKKGVIISLVVIAVLIIALIVMEVTVMGKIDAMKLDIINQINTIKPTVVEAVI
jgi:hypothetical protein